MTLQPKLARYRGPGLDALARGCRYLMALQRCVEEQPEMSTAHFIHPSAYDVEVRKYDAVVALGNPLT